MPYVARGEKSEAYYASFILVMKEKASVRFSHGHERGVFLLFFPYSKTTFHVFSILPKELQSGARHSGAAAETLTKTR